MSHSPGSMGELIDRITRWAENRPDIRAVIMVGSQARTDRPADEWSDLDLAVIALDADRYLLKADWLAEIGEYWLTFLEGTPVGAVERRVLFEGALDVDFSLFSLEQFRQVSGAPDVVADIVRRGVRVLVDKDGIAASLPPVAGEKVVARRPAEAEFLQVVHDFWYHTVWAAKKLRRGELFIAKASCDCYLKRLLADMIACHAHATHGWEYDTWHSGRFLDQWAGPRAVTGLREAYAHYDAGEVRRALLATMDLFRWVARETAERLGFDYPTSGDDRTSEWVHSCLRGVPG
jgi:aminoglycoside 6-adenylyltransferase